MPEVTDPNLLAILNGGSAPRSGPISSGVKLPTPSAPPTSIDNAKEARDQRLFDLTMQDRQEKGDEKAKKEAALDSQKSTAAAELRKLMLQLEQLRIDATDNGGFGETGTSGNIMRGIPVVANAAKDLTGDLEPIKSSNAFAALAGLAEQGIKLTPISNMEIKLASDSVANLDPSKSQETFLSQLDLARGKYLTTLAALEGKDEAALEKEINDEISAALGVDKSSTDYRDPNAPLGPSGPNYQAGPVEKYVTGDDRNRTAQLQSAYDNGASVEQMNAVLARLNVQPLSPEKAQFLMDARAKGQRINIAPFATGEQTITEKIVSSVADSPVGAYAIGAANGLTLGGLDEVAGMVGGEAAGERAQFAKEYSRENSPVSSMVGEVAGIAGLAALPGGSMIATGRGGVAAGGAYGALDMNENRLLGGAIGAGGGVLANKYGPQIGNALAGVAKPVIDGGRNALAAVGNRLPGAEGRAIARSEVTQNADVVASGQAENIPVRQPDVRPSLRDQYGGAEASQYGGPKIQKAASQDAQAIANRLAEVGGGGTTKQGYNLGSATQDAVSAQKDAMRGEAGAMYRRVDLQAPGFKAPAFEASKSVGAKIDAIKKLTPEGNEGQIAFLQKLENNLTSTGVSVESLQANRDLIRSKMKADNLSFTKAETDLLDVVNAAARDLEKGLQDSGNAAALQTLKRANAKWSEYVDFKRDVVKTIVGTKNQPVSPETAAQRLLGMVSSNGNSDKFAKVYKALPADEKAGFKALVAENLGKNARGDFSLALLAKGLDQKNINYKSLREVFSPDEFQSLMNLRRLADAKDKAMSGKNFSNTARAANNAPTGFGAFVRGALGFSVGDVMGATAAVAGPSLAERIGTKRTVDMLLNTDFSKWLANMPNTANPRAIDAYLAKLDRIKAPAVASNIVIFKDYLRQAATQSPRGLAAEQEDN